MTSTLKINTIEPEGATTTLTVGESGQNTVIAGAGIKANVAKDAGANALFTSNGSGVLSGVNAGFGSAQVLIQTQAFTDQATVSFTTGIDSTYKHYLFEFFNINPATAGANFEFQAGSSYNETMTTTFFVTYHYEADTASALEYVASSDQAQGTSYQRLAIDVGNDADQCADGELHIYNPASTTYIKNFYSVNNEAGNSLYSQQNFPAGYFNTTSALTQVQFKMSSGNFDGTIKLYGIK